MVRGYSGKSEFYLRYLGGEEMALTNEFINAVANNKKILVRIMLKDIMLVDSSMKTFNEMLSHAESNMDNLYDEHDGEKLNGNSATWTVDYMNQQMVSVVTNFSRERVNTLKKIVEFLYGNKVEETKETGSRTTAATSSSKNGLTGQQIVGGIVAVAGAGALICGIVNVPIAIVGGVAIAGGAVLFATGGNKGV